MPLYLACDLLSGQAALAGSLAKVAVAAKQCGTVWHSLLSPSLGAEQQAYGKMKIRDHAMNPSRWALR
jgi:hypothetical protein